MPNVRVEDLRFHDGQLFFAGEKGGRGVRENEEFKSDSSTGEASGFRYLTHL